MTLAPQAPAWVFLRAGFRAWAVAHTRGGPTIALGECQVNSPRLAMRWVRHRAENLADQLDAPYARPVRTWLRDSAELERALGSLAAGEPYVFRALDDQGTHYLFTAEPVEPVEPVQPAEPVGSFPGLRRSPGVGEP